MCFENCGEFRIVILNRTLKQQNMRPIFSDLTYKIVAFQDINEIQSDEIIQWAIEMIELGYRSENLFMLASFEKKSNFYEIENYLKKTLIELNLTPKKDKEAYVSYSYYYVLKISENKNVKENLAELYKYCQKWNYEENIYDFYLLYWAWNDFDYFSHSSYWYEATKENIQSLVIDKAKVWIEDNKSYFR
jgi:hypothetical protein